MAVAVAILGGVRERNEEVGVVSVSRPPVPLEGKLSETRLRGGTSGGDVLLSFPITLGVDLKVIMLRLLVKVGGATGAAVGDTATDIERFTPIF